MRCVMSGSYTKPTQCFIPNSVLARTKDVKPLMMSSLRSLSLNGMRFCCTKIVSDRVVVSRRGAHLRKACGLGLPIVLQGKLSTSE